MSEKDNSPAGETTLADVKQLGLWAAIASLGYVFWVVGGMEMIERLAYYGVRAVATLYATRPGLEGRTRCDDGDLRHAVVVLEPRAIAHPDFHRRASDRYGYKQTIFASTTVKSFGYLLMAWLPRYWGFFAARCFWPPARRVFKPGIQGTLIRATSRRNSSMAWGIFYQTVNIGGWIGPLIALHMRTMAWNYVFYTNAAFICLNFFLLLTYREPGKDERLARQQRIRDGNEKQRNLVLESLAELKKPHLSLYLLIFSVWWLMFPMLWDVLPKYVEDWVNTAPMVQLLFGPDGTHSVVWKFLLGMDAAGQTIQPEGIVNINAGHDHADVLSVCRAGREAARDHEHVRRHRAGGHRAHPVWREPQRRRSPSWRWSSSASARCWPAPSSANSSATSRRPTRRRCGSASPKRRSSSAGPSKANSARRSTTCFRRKTCSPGSCWSNAAWRRSKSPSRRCPSARRSRNSSPFTGESPEHLTQLLHQSHHVGMTWYIFAAIGVVSAVMIYFYGRWILKLAQRESAGS